MAEIMVLGDTHGNRDATCHAINEAGLRGVKTIIQVGDFGLWDHFLEGVWYLDDINEVLRRRGVRLYAVGGNHENWDRWEWYVANNPTDPFGFTILRSHIRLAPRTHVWEMHGKTMGAAGGAVSIDREARLTTEKGKGLGPRTLWWPNEELTDADVMAFPEGKVDYMFTHDCSNATPWKHRLKADMRSQIHRQRIDTLLKKACPDLHFHGHMHEKYDWVNMVGDPNGEMHLIQTYGLEQDGNFWNWGILDTETDEFEFRPLSPSVKAHVESK